MALQKRTKTLSRLSRALLAEGESEHADFRRSPNGVSQEDLVAFANSRAGGQILVGVDDRTIENVEFGVVRGCDVSDTAVLEIINKAASCIPAVLITIFIENLNEQPIFRIAVPSSATKPHCTSKGVYCRRDGPRNRVLHPGELAKIFRETETRAVAEPAGSTGKPADDNPTPPVHLSGEIDSKLESILDYLRRLDEEADDIAIRLRSLFRQDKREDPVRNREQDKFVKQLTQEIGAKKDLLRTILDGGAFTVKATGKAARELSEDDRRRALQDAIDVVRKERDIEK